MANNTIRTLDPATPHGRFRTIVDGAESPYGIGDFYTGPLLDAQLLFARTVGERRCACQAASATSWRMTGAP